MAQCGLLLLAQCCIDLQKNVLRLQEGATTHDVPFLPEHVRDVVSWYLPSRCFVTAVVTQLLLACHDCRRSQCRSVLAAATRARQRLRPQLSLRLQRRTHPEATRATSTRSSGSSHWALSGSGCVCVDSEMVGLLVKGSLVGLHNLSVARRSKRSRRRMGTWSWRRGCCSRRSGSVQTRRNNRLGRVKRFVLRTYRSWSKHSIEGGHGAR